MASLDSPENFSDYGRSFEWSSKCVGEVKSCPPYYSFCEDIEVISPKIDGERLVGQFVSDRMFKREELSIDDIIKIVNDEA